MKIAIQMDPIANIHIKSDTSLALLLEAQNLGYELFYYTPDQLALENNKVYAKVHSISVKDQEGNHFILGDPCRINLADMDVILLRQDPPFNMDYITSTHILEKLENDCLIINNAFWVRNSPEKIFVTQFPDLMPETLITKSHAEAVAFRKKYGDIIIKPLYGNGGTGVFLIRKDDPNLNSLLELFTQLYKEAFIVQRYLKDVSKGDKRIILLDGEPVGAINRIASKGETRSNLHMGAQAHRVKLTKRDHEICQKIGPFLKERGLFLVGIDIIGDYITEINVTSPTGIREVFALDNINIAKQFWQKISEKLT